MNRKYLGYSLLLLLFFVGSVFSQVNEEDEPVKVTTNLVQFDAVVTDKKGNAVTDLTINDFEIYQDKKLQTITNFNFVNQIRNVQQSELKLQNKPSKETITSPIPINSNEIGRILTFIIDDGNPSSSLEGMRAIKEALKKFITEQMLPTDKVAIFQTRGGTSLFQQYTSDKELLLSIVKRLRWLPPSGSNQPMPNYSDRFFGSRIVDDSSNRTNGLEENSQTEAIKDFTIDSDYRGLHGVIEYVIRGLYHINGRKNVILMSEAMYVLNPEGERKIKEMAALANRASVVLNSMDPRGLTVPMIMTADNVSSSRTTQTLNARARDNFARLNGLSLVANETGGKFYRNMNFLEVGIERLLKMEKGYYLLAYEPDEEIFRGKEFHKIEIKLKRNDLEIRTRSGFFAVTDDKLKPKSKNNESDLYYALTSPVWDSIFDMSLSAYYLNTQEKGDLIRAMIYVDGTSLTFTDDANGNKKASFDIVAVTLNEKNEIIDDSNKNIKFQIPPNRVAEIRRDGLIYTIDVPVKREGVYTFRVAMKENSVNQVGTASQVIEIPSLKKGNLLVSGLSIAGVDSNGKMLESEGKDTTFSLVSSPALPSVRQFVRNSIVGYSYRIYNAKLTKSTNKPNLIVQTNLYYDGKLFVEGQPQPAEISNLSDIHRIDDFGYLRLNAEIPIGDYILQIRVTDLNKKQTSSQWIDFEVVK